MSRTLSNNQNNGVFFYISIYEDNNNDTRQYCRIFTFTLAIVNRSWTMNLSCASVWSCWTLAWGVYITDDFKSKCNCSKPPYRYLYENTSKSVICLSKWSSLYNLVFCVCSVNIQANGFITNKDLENNQLYFFNQYQ